MHTFCRSIIAYVLVQDYVQCIRTIQCVQTVPQAAQSSLRVELSEAHRERGQMEASLRGYRTQEQDYKRCVLPSLEGVVNFIFLFSSVSTIQKLEEKARHLQHVNNRLHGQATHYSVGLAGAISTNLSISPPS